MFNVLVVLAHFEYFPLLASRKIETPPIESMTSLLHRLLKFLLYFSKEKVKKEIEIKLIIF